ncbi:MAG TPA: TonB-dependent receptor [Candidatus Binataceae bacterium]|nr:TonB-dependent receptor [Candidatus Binataceae bacterium]
MSKFLLASALLLILALVHTSTVTAAQKKPRTMVTRTIKGTIKDALGRPIEGASVVLQSNTGKQVATVTSAKDGAFTISAHPGVYAIVVTKESFKSATQIVTVSRAGAKPVEISLASQAALSLAVVARKLDRARNSLSPTTGGSKYTFDQKALQELPQGNNTPLNQVLLQAPGVVQDSYGQLHVRGDHANLQYRVNGILLPEGVTGFGQVITPRFAQNISLLTGALPAQYGLRTAGIVDIRTKDGLLDPVGDVEMYGGQRGTTQPSFEWGGSKGDFSYFMTGQYFGSDRGLEPPSSGPTAIHDTTNQGAGFGYFSYFINPTTRLSLMTGTAINHFQIPANPDQPQVFDLAGVPTYPSGKVRENQTEQNYFAVLALQGEVGPDIDYQLAPFTRYSNVSFNPDYVGDLIYNGDASKVFRSDWASGFQLDTAYHGIAHHTFRLGGSFWGERAEIDNHAAVFKTNSAGMQIPPFLPISITDDTALTSWYYSGYIQDEWKPWEPLTVNYGVRFDLYDGLVRADQASPRIGFVYTPWKHTAFHGAYARYFTPPPTELVSVNSIQAFQNTTGAPPSNGNGTPTVQRDHYFDAGVDQEILSGLNVGIDSYYRKSSELIDEGQFGPALIFETFNYHKGRNWGVEATSSYTHKNATVYGNFTYSVGQGTQVDSGQFNFAPDELSYINGHYVFLDHDQTFAASWGASYTWHGYLASVDGIYGSGLRSGFANTGNLPYYVQLNAGISKRVEAGRAGAFVFRGTWENFNDHIYLIRNGTGIGVFANQYGPRSAVYGGIKWEIPGLNPKPSGS